MAEELGGSPQELEDRLSSVVAETEKKEGEGDLLDGLERVDPVDAGEIADAVLRTHLTELADGAENEIVLGPKFEEIKEDLDKLIAERTTPEARRAVVVLLKEEYEDLTFDETVDYGGVKEADLLEMTKLRSAVRVVEAGVARRGDQWNTYEDAARFLQDEYNIKVLQEEEEDTEEFPENEVNFAEQTEAIIAANEKAYLDLLMRDFGLDVFITPTGGHNAMNLELCEDLLVASGYKDYWDEYNTPAGATDSAMFQFVQTLYLEHILGAAYLNDLEKTKNIILKEQEEIAKNKDGRGDDKYKKRLSDFIQDRGRKVESYVKAVAAPINRVDRTKGGRGWGFNNDIAPAEYLKKRFFLLEQDENEGEYSSDLDWISEILVENYSRDNYIKTNVYNREGWTPEENNLFDSVLNLHDFALVVNGSKFVDKEIRDDLIRSIDGDIKNIINIQNKDDEYIIPAALEAYDRVLREFAQANENKPISIDDSSVRDSVKKWLEDSGLQLSDTEMKMLLSVGRSLCGMFGIDSQFYYASKQSGDENKFESLPYGSKGTLMNEAFNIVAIELPFHTDPKKVPYDSYKNIDLGVVPFVNSKEIMNSSEPFSEPFDAEMLREKINGLTIGTEYQNWINNVIGASAAAKAEKKVLTHSQDPIGQLKLIMNEYGYKSSKKIPYVIGRTRDIVSVFLDRRRKMPIKDVLTTKFLSDLNTEFGLFPDDNTLNDFLNTCSSKKEENGRFNLIKRIANGIRKLRDSRSVGEFNLPAKDDPDEVNEVIKTMSGLYGEKAKKDYMNSGKFLQFVKDNPRAAKKIVKRGGFLSDLIGEIKSSRR